MSITNVSLYVPTEIEKGLLSGRYLQYGSIIRDNSGHIVKHLKEINPQTINQGVVKNNLNIKYKKIGTIVASTMVVGGVGYYIYSKNNQNRILRKLINNLKNFIDYAKRGEVSEKFVDKFLEFLIKNEKQLLELSFEHKVNVLLLLIYQYTVEFAEVNKFDVDNLLMLDMTKDNNIIDLKNYLTLQKEIYNSNKM